MNSKENVEIICEHCMEIEKQKWQKENKDRPINIGDSVKLPISDGISKEYMWVIVMAKNRNKFIGELNNIPMALQNIELGQPVLFYRQDIVNSKAK